MNRLLKMLISLVLFFETLAVRGQELSAYDVPKTLEYLIQKVDKTNLIAVDTVSNSSSMDFYSVRSLNGYKLEITHTNSFTVLLPSHISPHRSQTATKLVLDFSKLDPDSVRYSKQTSTDHFSVFVETTNQEPIIPRVYTDITTNKSLSNSVTRCEIQVKEEKDARRLVSAIGHLIKLQGGKSSKKGPFDK